MNDFGTPLGGKVVPAALDAFENDYFNTPLPAGSVSTILTEAFKALLDAGVVVLEDGTPASDLTIRVHGGRVDYRERIQRPARSSITCMPAMAFPISTRR